MFRCSVMFVSIFCVPFFSEFSFDFFFLCMFSFYVGFDMLGELPVNCPWTNSASFAHPYSCADLMQLAHDIMLFAYMFPSAYLQFHRASAIHTTIVRCIPRSHLVLCSLAPVFPLLSPLGVCVFFSQCVY